MADSIPPVADVPPAPSQAVSATTGLPSNIAAGLASIFPLVGGAIFLLVERRDKFVRFYSVQSVLLGALAVVVWISIAMVDFIFRAIPLLGGFLATMMGGAHRIFSLIWFVIYVVMIVKAFMGREWEIPYLGQIARRQSAERPV